MNIFDLIMSQTNTIGNIEMKSEGVKYQISVVSSLLVYAANIILVLESGRLVCRTIGKDINNYVLQMILNHEPSLIQIPYPAEELSIVLKTNVKRVIDILTLVTIGCVAITIHIT